MDLFEKISLEVEEIESSIKLDQFTYNKICIWPIIRVGYYMSRKKELSQRSKPSNVRKILNGLNDCLVKLISKMKGNYSIGNIETIYFGANTHRTNLDGHLLNRYFSHRLDDNSLLVEYNNSLLFLDKKSIDNWRLIDFVKFRDEVLHLKKDFKLIKLLETLKFFFKNIHEEIVLFTIEVLAYNKLYRRLFQECSIKEIYLLSYYSPPAFGACIAANHTGIKTIEVQHGPIGKYHLAYSQSKHFNLQQTNLLPSEIHLWHKNFVYLVSKTFKNTSVTGNYYLNRYSKRNLETSLCQKILISLQPKDTTLPKIYDKIIEKFKDEFTIIIRLHPRLKKNKLLIKYLKKFNKIGVKISDPYLTPLHKDLENCALHLTGYSGTTIEAFSMNVPSILYDSKAKSFFEDFQDNKNIIFDFDNNEEQSLKLINLCLRERKKI